MKKVILTIGAPGSGKSVWAKQEALKKGTIRISGDSVRRMMGDYWVPEREGIVLRVVRDIYQEAIQDVYTNRVIIDEINLDPMTRLTWLEWILDIDPKVKVEYKSFLGVPLATLKERNKSRADRSVPTATVEYFWGRTQNAENTPEAFKKELEEFFKKEQAYRLEIAAKKEKNLQ